MQKRFLSLMVMLLVAGAASAEVKLPSIFSSHMVLQRELPIAVWGTADAGEKVTVTLGKDSKTTAADAKGHWRVDLPARPASDTPAVLSVEGANKVTFDDVLVGEVWVCSGQSNMEFRVAQSTGGEKAIADSNHPMLRIFDVPRHITALEPQADAPGAWAVSSPDAVKGFTAVGYYFGLDLMEKLHVPIGLIGTNWGGTPAEAWTRYSALESESSLKPLLANWKKQQAGYDPAKAKKAYEDAMVKWKEAAAKAKAAGKGAPRQPGMQGEPSLNSHYPAAIYNGMLAPIIPYTIRGAIWYQGESNCSRAYQYRTIFSTMIKSWREDWSIDGNKDFPFYFVQIAPYSYGAPTADKPQYLPELWDAQTYAYTHLPNVGFAVTTDVATTNNIHPPNKQPVGERLARWALAKTYGWTDLVYTGPILDKVQFKDGKAIVHYLAGSAKGLKTADGKAPDNFVIAGADQKFVPAEAKIAGDTVIVWSDQVKDPKAVRFAPMNISTPNLFNAEGLPASPFRTDDWPQITQNSN
ncbi:MAG: sialate O-acetylesterase [Planctomycetes bacterium]|nr:sialate O-acetylesterase [Planctomycetota bacterium]